MEDMLTNNFVELCGLCAEAPKISHRSRDAVYLGFPIDTERLSGAVDRVNILVRSDMPGAADMKCGDMVSVRGELRSFNNKSGEGPRLVITVFARELGSEGELNTNLIRLRGTICQSPNYRHTPMGREICDLMLAVNRRYGRADYLPCIAWGQNARRLRELDVGAVLELEGRVQSRKYIKLIDDTAVEKTAFEVSVTTANVL